MKSALPMDQTIHQVVLKFWWTVPGELYVTICLTYMPRMLFVECWDSLLQEVFTAALVLMAVELDQYGWIIFYAREMKNL